MRRKPPDLRDLVGEDVPAAELERLARVHELLVHAGPPPELPGELAEPPEPDSTVALLPKRHWRPLAALAAALALAAFGAGWLAASARDSGDRLVPGGRLPRANAGDGRGPQRRRLDRRPRAGRELATGRWP